MTGGGTWGGQRQVRCQPGLYFAEFWVRHSVPPWSSKGRGEVKDRGQDLQGKGPKGRGGAPQTPRSPTQLADLRLVLASSSQHLPPRTCS